MGLKIIVALLYFACLSSIQTSQAFKCYVCDSSKDTECTENLPPNFQLQPRDCQNIQDAKYCVKTTNMYAGELGTKRFCAANDHGTRCQWIKQITGDREYRSCVYTCDSEACNGAQTLTKADFYLMIMLLSVVLTLFSFSAANINLIDIVL